MNNKGQVFVLTIMIAIVFILFALAVSPAISEFNTNARNPTTDTQVGLDCSNSTISNFDKASCIFVDLYNPVFIGTLIFIGGAIVAAKVIGG